MSLSRKLATRVLSKKSSLEEVVHLLTKYKMLSLLPSLKKEMIAMRDMFEKKTSMRIDSPFPLSDESIATIKTIVGDVDAKADVVINKDILAGFQARYKGMLYDGSAQRIIKQLVNSNK